MTQDEAELRRELALVEDRLDRAGGRLAFGYGDDADRETWRRWIAQLRARRDELRRALGEAAGDERSDG